MKGDLLVLNEELTFFFRKNDVKTNSDREAIRLIIHQMYHMHSKWSTHDINDVKNIINNSKTSYIGLTMENNSPDEYNYNLKILNFSGTNFKLAKLAHEQNAIES